VKPEKNVTKGLHIHLKLPKIVLFVVFNLFLGIFIYFRAGREAQQW
jgi:hypothetical protein